MAETAIRLRADQQPQLVASGVYIEGMMGAVTEIPRTLLALEQRSGSSALDWQVFVQSK